MKLSVTADIITAVYYNGRPKSTADKLDRRDFFQFALASAGSIIRKIFYEEREVNDGDVTAFIASMVDVKALKIEKGKLGIRYLEEEIFILPKNMGILNIWPIILCKEDQDPDDGEIDYSNAFARLQTGSEFIFTDEVIEDIGVMGFSSRGSKAILRCPKDMTYVAVQAMFKQDDYDLPESIAREIINDVLGPTLKVAGFPIDMTQNGNPNVELVNQKIAQSQT